MLDDINPKVISYMDYPDIAQGVVSHGDVLKLSLLMFREYPKLSRLVSDCYPFILVDEYQDTDPRVIEILFEHVAAGKEGHAAIALFGDAMQSIYEYSVGDAQNLVDNHDVTLFEINQNRRNPTSVIELANRLRTDGIVQRPSDDADAPNMDEDGNPIDGTARFAFVPPNTSMQTILNSHLCDTWNADETKTLCLTHRIIAREAHFENLWRIYSQGNKARQNDQSFHFTRDKLTDHINADGFSNDWDPVTGFVRRAYALVESYSLKEFDATLSLVNPNLFNRDNALGTIFDRLISMNQLFESPTSTVGELLNQCRGSNLVAYDFPGLACFQHNNAEAFNELTSLTLAEYQHFFEYVNEKTPFSTQHKVKGLEYDNVLVLLDNGGWNKYHFEYVFQDKVAHQHNSECFQSVKERSQKLLYVCCTRAKRNLLVCMATKKPSDIAPLHDGVVAKFGKNNVIDCSSGISPYLP